jgi:hypothetical protein
MKRRDFLKGSAAALVATPIAVTIVKASGDAKAPLPTPPTPPVVKPTGATAALFDGDPHNEGRELDFVGYERVSLVRDVDDPTEYSATWGCQKIRNRSRATHYAFFLGDKLLFSSVMDYCYLVNVHETITLRVKIDFNGDYLDTVSNQHLLAHALGFRD